MRDVQAAGDLTRTIQGDTITRVSSKPLKITNKIGQMVPAKCVDGLPKYGLF